MHNLVIAFILISIAVSVGASVFLLLKAISFIIDIIIYFFINKKSKRK